MRTDREPPVDYGPHVLGAIFGICILILMHARLIKAAANLANLRFIQPDHTRPESSSAPQPLKFSWALGISAMTSSVLAAFTFVAYVSYEQVRQNLTSAGFPLVAAYFFLFAFIAYTWLKPTLEQAVRLTLVYGVLAAVVHSAIYGIVWAVWHFN